MRKIILLAAALLWMGASAAWCATALLPDLVNWAKQGTYMYDARIEYDANGHKLLRFSAAAANAGRGPFELNGHVEPDGTTTAYQRIYYDDGTYQDRFAGSFVFSGHQGHNHFHYADFAAYNVRSVTVDGGVGGIIRSSPKVGFAMWDVAAYNKNLPGAPQQPVYQRPDGMTLPPEGISVGWADIYASNLDEQWIDVTGMPDGDYWLENVMDPNNTLVEMTKANNSTVLKFRIIRDNIGFYGEPQGGPPPQLPAAFGDFRTYPNPWRGDQHIGTPLKFLPLPDGSVVKIYSSSGKFLRGVNALSGEANWNLKDQDGMSVSTGYYFFRVEVPGVGQHKGHVAVIK